MLQARLLVGASIFIAAPALATPALVIPPEGSSVTANRAAVFQTDSVRYSIFQSNLRWASTLAPTPAKQHSWAMVVGVGSGVRVDSVWNALFPALDDATAPVVEQRSCERKTSEQFLTANVVASAAAISPVSIERLEDASAAQALLSAWGLSSPQFSSFANEVAKAKLSFLVIHFESSEAQTTETTPLRLFESVPSSKVPAVQMFGDFSEFQSWSFGEMPVAWSSLIEHRVSNSQIPAGADALSTYRSFIDVPSTVHIEARDYFSVGLGGNGWKQVTLYNAIKARSAPLTPQCASALAKPPCAPGTLFGGPDLSCSLPAECAPYREAAWFGDGYVTRAVLHASLGAPQASESTTAVDVNPWVRAADCPTGGGYVPTPGSTARPRGGDPPRSDDDDDDNGDAVGSAACGACLSVAEAGSSEGCSGSDPGYDDSSSCSGDSSDSDSSGCSNSSGGEDCRVSRSKRRRHGYLSRYGLAAAMVALIVRRRFRPRRAA